MGCGVKPALTSANFKEMRATAKRAIELAAKRFRVTLEEALDRGDCDCVGARWSTWLALDLLEWRPEDIARLFYVDRTAILYAKKRAHAEHFEYAAAIVAELTAATENHAA
ncbi:hypothetical protein OV203_02580 [Nannocystis sp. ILAH1]|uniref:hypothetical protein n=1 Tax=Nannocystis sp. ILAH1 TaxID=2996789 RepID=UPI002271F1C0|nr:hypothetical protein [Nannocystis sp. ILAH1]MCY0985998.1 hypothetical protein [Nannocystis sp. ILAH1]